MMCRVKPDVVRDKEKERNLQRIATRCVNHGLHYWSFIVLIMSVVLYSDALSDFCNDGDELWRLLVKTIFD